MSLTSERTLIRLLATNRLVGTYYAILYLGNIIRLQLRGHHSVLLRRLHAPRLAAGHRLLWLRRQDPVMPNLLDKSSIQGRIHFDGKTVTNVAAVRMNETRVHILLAMTECETYATS